MPITMQIVTGVPGFDSFRSLWQAMSFVYMDQRWCNPVALTYVMYGLAVEARKCHFLLPH
jgi:hypothetical protein